MKSALYLITILLFVNISFASELSLSNTSEYTPSLSNRVSIWGTLNPNLRQLTSLNTISASYASRLSIYWLEFNFQASSGMFQKMSMNNTLATGLTDADLFDARSTHSSLGVGAMLESNYARTFFNSESLYETSSAYLTYNMFKAGAVPSTFTGPGIMTKFSLCKKFSDVFSLGANLNYQLASVKRASNADTETSSVQSLTVSYVTIGLELILTL